MVAGITPAHAGNTCLHGQRRIFSRDHPRTRGEYVMYAASSSRSKGSPPHTRGIPHPCLFWHWLSGITPAHAGNTRKGDCDGYSYWDHPRTRGEYYTLSAKITGDSGSPPHTRGILLLNRKTICQVGITPAHAGNTLSILASW